MLDEIGAGRFGPVYRAEDERGIAGTVALKVFSLPLSVAQAAALAQALTSLCEAPLDHPTIVAPIAAGLAETTPWVAEPYVNGTPLDAILRRQGPQPLADVLLRITQVAGALDFAAAAGVHHGALHPRDILFAGDRTLVTGFGVVQALNDAALEMPMSGSVVSPQQALGAPVGHADDIFALAAITFEVLFGHPLRDRASLRSLIAPVEGVDHERLRNVLMGALAEDPADRPATALAFAGELQKSIDVGVREPVRPMRVDAPALTSSMPAVADVPMPVRVPVPVDDLPLRTEEPAVVRNPAAFEPEVAAFEPEFETHRVADRVFEPELPPASPAVSPTVVMPGRDFGFESRARERSGVPWVPVVAMLALAALMGFGAGFVVGQREATPAPRSAERAVSRAEREPQPAPTTGQDFTESPLPESAERQPSTAGPTPQSVEEGPVLPSEPEIEPERVPPAATRAGSATPRQVPSADVTPDGRASLEVVSRPAGAQVFLDGRLVGRTPLVLSGVNPGEHAVRLTMPGHQRWVTNVNVAPGLRARVAASLER